MRRFFYAVLAGVSVILGSCVTTDLNSQYNVSYLDSLSGSPCISVEKVKIRGTRIDMNIVNLSSETVVLLLGESFIVHDNNIKDEIFIETDIDSILVDPPDVILPPEHYYNDFFYPRSLCSVNGYNGLTYGFGKPIIQHRSMRPISFTLYYKANTASTEKQSLTINFERLPAQS